MVPGVLEPQLDVRRRVDQLALHDERVDVRAQPAGEPLVPGTVARDHPVREHLAPAALGEVRGRGADDVLDHLVAGQPRVAVDQPLAGRGRDDERRVGGDQVVPLAAHRLEEGPVTHLDPVADLVEGGVEPGDAERPLVDVGRDHVVAVRGEVQRLHAAAGAEVEAARRRDRAG